MNCSILNQIISAMVNFRLFVKTIFVVLSIPAIIFSQPLFKTQSDIQSRSRHYDLLHSTLNFSFDIDKKEVHGQIRHFFQSLRDTNSRLKLDADNFRYNSIKVNDIPAEYHFDSVKSKLYITLPKMVDYGDSLILDIDYIVENPKKGIYFFPASKSNRPQIWTQGEDEDTHFWLPTFDFPNDKATLETFITIDSSLSVLSNGSLISKSSNSNGTATWHYKQDKPISTYLFMLAIGKYLVAKDTADGVPLEYWIYPDKLENMKRSVGMTPSAMKFFNHLIGVPYPWSKYAQIFIEHFMFGGMENVGATTLTDHALHDARADIEHSSEGLVSHELAHQWFGDLVTNRNWQHLWLHEGFATFYATLFSDFWRGNEFADVDFDRQLTESLVHEKSAGRNPIVKVGGSSTNLYPRGSRVLKMLRFELGDSAFHRAIKYYLQKHAYGNVETNDLKIAIEEVTGENLWWFFDEWLYKAGHPVFQVRHDFNTKSKKVEMTVEQIQKKDSLTGYFKMPIQIDYAVGGKLYSERKWIKSDSITTIELPAESQPDYVIFDAGDILIKERTYKRPETEVIAQMNTAPKMIDRLSAVRDLKNFGTTSSTKALISAITIEKHWRIREEISKILVELKISDTKGLFLSLLEDKNYAVRTSALDYFLTYYEKEPILKALEDSSLTVVGKAIKILAEKQPEIALSWIEKTKTIIGYRFSFSRVLLDALENIGSKKAMDNVVEFTKPEFENRIRQKAYSILEKGKEISQETDQSIKLGLQDSNENIRLAALLLAEAKGKKSLLPLLNKLMDKTTVKIQKDRYLKAIQAIEGNK